MSTRCVVRFVCNGHSVDLYHHCDGYPEGVGFFLMKEMEKVKKGNNYSYSNGNDIVSRWIRECNFEPTFYNHCDIDFYYEFNMDGKWTNGMSVDCWDGKEMKIIQKYPLEEYYRKHKDADVCLYCEKED